MEQADYSALPVTPDHLLDQVISRNQEWISGWIRSAPAERRSAVRRGCPARDAPARRSVCEGAWRQADEAHPISTWWHTLCDGRYSIPGIATTSTPFTCRCAT